MKMIPAGLLFFLAVSLAWGAKPLLLPFVGARQVAMGGYNGALTWDPAAIYSNPAAASGDGSMQIEFFTTDTAAKGIPDNWGVVVRKPSDTKSSGAGLLLLHRALFVDTSFVRATQFEFAITDARMGFPIGGGAKMVWEQRTPGGRWIGGFSLDLGTMINLGNLRLGGTVKNIVGMPLVTEPRHVEAGAAVKVGTFLLSGGAASEEVVANTLIDQAKMNWSYGAEWKPIPTLALRSGRFAYNGQHGMSYGVAYATEDDGIILGYSMRQFDDAKDVTTHWLSYGYTPLAR